MRVDNTPSQPSKFNHVAGGIATAIGAATFIKITGLGDIITYLNPITLFTRAPLTAEEQTVLEKDKETTATDAATAKRDLDNVSAEAATAATAKANAEEALASAKKTAEAANAALSQHNAVITDQNNVYNAITERCAKVGTDANVALKSHDSTREILRKAAEDAEGKLKEATDSLEAAKQAVESAKQSAASAATDATNKLNALASTRTTFSQGVQKANSDLTAETNKLASARQALESAQKNVVSAATPEAKKAAEALLANEQTAVSAVEAAQRKAQEAVNQAVKDLGGFEDGFPQQSAAIEEAKKNAQELISVKEAALPGAETIEQAKDAAKTAAEKLKGFEDQVAQESSVFGAAKTACDKEIDSAAAKLGELTPQKDALALANTTAYDSLDKVQAELNGKVEIANAAEGARAKAEEIATEKARIAAETASKDTLYGRFKETVSDGWNGLKTRASNVVTSTQELALENKEFIGATVGFACTYYAVDVLAADRIKNRYVRGAFSFATAFVAVWTASNFGFKNEMHATTTLMYGATTVGATLVAKHLAPHAGKLFSGLYHGSNWLGNRNLTLVRE